MPPRITRPYVAETWKPVSPHTHTLAGSVWGETGFCLPCTLRAGARLPRPCIEPTPIQPPHPNRNPVSIVGLGQSIHSSF
jgi:hypothetical protein